MMKREGVKLLLMEDFYNKSVAELAHELLANPVIEEFSVHPA